MNEETMLEMEMNGILAKLDNLWDVLYFSS